MKRLNDLLSGKEKIKVESVTTNNIVASGNIPLISYNNYTLSLSKNLSLISTIELYSSENINFTSETFGEIILEDTGLNFNIPNGIHLYDTRFSFSFYTTAERPTAVNEGEVIYDSTLKKCILYNGTAWVNLDGTALA